MIVFAAWIFAALAALVAAFQLALVAGAPWGHLTQGGRNPGRLPPAARGAAALSAVLIVVVAWIVLTDAGVVGTGAGAGRWIWLAVALSALTALANTVTPSRAERALWMPVTLVLLAASLTVALGTG